MERPTIPVKLWPLKHAQCRHMRKLMPTNQSRDFKDPRSTVAITYFVIYLKILLRTHTYYILIEIINRTLQIYLRKIITSAYRHSILGIECIWSIKLIFRSTHNSSSSFDQRYENKTQRQVQNLLLTLFRVIARAYSFHALPAKNSSQFFDWITSHKRSIRFCFQWPLNASMFFVYTCDLNEM